MSPLAALRRALARPDAPLNCVLLAFVASRLVAFKAGLRFDMFFTPMHWHFADFEWLRTRLLETLWHLHSQPPVMNLLLGGALKLFPGHEASALHAVFLGCGLLFAWSLYTLMVGLGVGRWLSAGLTIVFIVSPASLLYENYWFYTYPTAAMLCGAGAFLVRYLERRRALDGLACLMLLALVCLTRAMFHLVWLLAVIGLIAWFVRGDRRMLFRTLGLSVLPVALVFGLYAKNAVLFGTFASSSWMGMNMSRIALFTVPDAERAAMRERGELSELSAYSPFARVSTYPPRYARVPETGVPVLDQETKHGTYLNLNHLAYVDISRQFQRDSLAALRAYPAGYLQGLRHAALISLYPASDYVFLRPNLEKIVAYEQFYSTVLLGRWLPLEAEPIAMRLSVIGQVDRTGLYLWGLPLLFGFGLWRFWRAMRAGRRQEAALVGFMCLNIAYVVLIGNGLEVAENNRFRFKVDAFFVALLGLLLSGLSGRPRRPPAITPRS